MPFSREGQGAASFDNDNAHDLDVAMAMAASLDRETKEQHDNPLSVGFEPEAETMEIGARASTLGSPPAERKSGPSRSGQDFLAYRNSMRRVEPVTPMHVARSVVEEDV